MFKQFQNIDSAFRNIRLFSIAFLLANCIICCFLLYTTYQEKKLATSRIYFIANGKLMDAVAIDRNDVLTVQLRKHVELYHHFFYSLEPDEELNKKNITRALYLADDKAKIEYDNLREQGYYTGIVSSNISQRIEMDSIRLNTDKEPYYFQYYGKLRIIRSTSIATRSLITEGYLRPLQTISDNNSYGFLIERWRIIENKDLTIEKR
jgi:conjugative transposon TraK protein